MLKTAIFIVLLFTFGVFAQEQEAETPQQPAKKANQRPTESTQPTEPFDNTDVKTMSATCVKLETESGDIELEMFPESAPETVRNFLNLTAIGFFDTTIFSRIVPNFVVQGGNFSTRLQKPMELYERSRRNIKDEPSLIKHERGIVSMARSDEPNTASTHFFILISDAPHLDGKFAAFARVTKGLEIADEINKMPVSEEKPTKPVRLLTATTFPCLEKVEQ